MAELDDSIPLAVGVTHGAGGPVVKISGELDLSNVATVEAAVSPLLEPAPERLVFDLSGLRFMDSSAIALFIRTAARVGTVTLTNPSDVVRQIVHATGLSDLLHLEP